MAKRPKQNPNLADDLRTQAEYRETVRNAAETVRDHAAVFARTAGEPWMRRQAQTMVVSTSGDETAVVNTDYAGHLAEWGSIRNPPHAPLRRGARAAGLHFEENPQ